VGQLQDLILKGTFIRLGQNGRVWPTLSHAKAQPAAMSLRKGPSQTREWMAWQRRQEQQMLLRESAAQSTAAVALYTPQDYGKLSFAIAACLDEGGAAITTHRALVHNYRESVNGC
jgi:hypothetical protein